MNTKLVQAIKVADEFTAARRVFSKRAEALEVLNLVRQEEKVVANIRQGSISGDSSLLNTNLEEAEKLKLQESPWFRIGGIVKDILKPFDCSMPEIKAYSNRKRLASLARIMKVESKKVDTEAQKGLPEEYMLAKKY